MFAILHPMQTFQLRTKSFFSFGALVAVAAACSGTVVQSGPVVSGGGLQVTLAIASATLGDEGCAPAVSSREPAPSGLTAGDCAQDADGGGCSYTCTPSNIQISMTAGSSGSAATVTVTRVVLVDGTSGAEIQVLSASAPSAWNGSSYASWDSILRPSANVKASYPLSSPTWSSLSSSARDAYSKPYRIQVTVDVGGTKSTLSSEQLTRPAVLAT
jgi:hypothetical protein